MGRVLLAQAALALLAGALFAARSGAEAGLAAVYGGAIVVLNGLLLRRHLAAIRPEAAARGAATLYLGLVQRLVLAVGLLAVGLGLLELAPLPLVAGFIAAQFGYLFNIGAER
ncbi:ATP synthase subunit I [Inmirania thermothiophila]|uniref:ATP synthase protein I n=1 Tax=Inmirania thermothiophila TaxID=1750597 RepID=A0A3N1Y690_9GAMM|nr:ATP synthase subunit I [Inmirania thermothiophila]ROR34336.1 ATP synthase protein I [Inmirania thermothiophila]